MTAERRPKYRSNSAPDVAFVPRAEMPVRALDGRRVGRAPKQPYVVASIASSVDHIANAIHTRRCRSKWRMPMLPITQQHRLWFVSVCLWLHSIHHDGWSVWSACRQNGGTPSSSSSQHGSTQHRSASIDCSRCWIFIFDERSAMRDRNVSCLVIALLFPGLLLGRAGEPTVAFVEPRSGSEARARASSIGGSFFIARHGPGRHVNWRRTDGRGTAREGRLATCG